MADTTGYWPTENIYAAIKQAECDLVQRIDTESDKISDKMTQEYIAHVQASERQTDRIADRLHETSSKTQEEVRAGDWKNEVRADNIGKTLTDQNVYFTNSLERQTDRVNDQVRSAATVLGTAVENARFEIRDAAAAQALQSAAIKEAIWKDGAETRALINHNYVTDVRDRLERTHDELVELRGDRRYYDNEFRRYDRDFAALNTNALLSNFTSQINAVNSNLQNFHQQAAQGTVNFGHMSGNAGRNTSTNNVA